MNGERLMMNGERLMMNDGQRALCKLFRAAMGILFILLLLSGCERRDLTYYTEAEIEISVDWSSAGLPDIEKDYGATAVFYPVDGSRPSVVLLGDRTRKIVRLPEGRYDVIVFNRSFDDFGAIGFRGTERFATLEAYANRRATRGEVITTCPEALAADRIEGFEVTAGMLGNYSPEVRGGNRSSNDGNGSTGNDGNPGDASDPCRLCFTPRKLTKEVTVEVNIKGMNNIRSATCTLSGVAEGVFLATGEPSPATVTQAFDLENPVYDPGSMWDGTMEATFSVFDFNEAAPHDLHLEASLVDGKTEFSEDFEQVDISRKEDGKGGITLVIEATTTQPVPDVPPEGGSGSGMGAEVEDWGDVEEGVIEI